MGMESVFRLSVVMGMIDNLTAPLSGVAADVEDTTKKLNDAFGTVQKAGAALAGAGAGITTACLATVTSTFETQDALGELSSLGVADLKAVEDAAKSFSDTWAGTIKSDFITASYDIKSGIASLSDEGVAQFTELAALTGKATKSTTEEMGSLFATGYGIYKGAYDDLSDLEFGEMFSAGIATAVKNYKTAGSEMASSISALGATAVNNKVPLEEQLAILGQLQTTMSGSEAATKYKSFLNQAASAGDKLGLSFVDANNQLLSTPEILAKLQGKYGDTIDAVEKQQLKEAFGTDEAVAMIDLLYNDIGGLSGGIDAMAQSMKQGGAVTKEMAEAINNTPAQKFEVLAARYPTHLWQRFLCCRKFLSADSGMPPTCSIAARPPPLPLQSLSRPSRSVSLRRRCLKPSMLLLQQQSRLSWYGQLYRLSRSSRSRCQGQPAACQAVMLCS